MNFQPYFRMLEGKIWRYGTWLENVATLIQSSLLTFMWTFLCVDRCNWNPFPPNRLIMMRGTQGLIVGSFIQCWWFRAFLRKLSRVPLVCKLPPALTLARKGPCTGFHGFAEPCRPRSSRNFKPSSSLLSLPESNRTSLRTNSLGLPYHRDLPW